MIIDDKLKLIFIHIPKTGGTSIHQWLKEQNSSTLSFWGVKDNIDLAHLTLEKGLEIIPNFNQSYFKFAFVRHPLYRIYSAYLQPYKQLYPNLTFNQFLEKFVKKISTIEGKSDPALVHLWPMSSFIKINNKVSVDFIGRMENWDSDIEFLKSIFAIKGFPSHLNKSDPCRNSDYSLQLAKKLYTRSQKDLIYQIYLEDYQIFGYIND